MRVGEDFSGLNADPAHIWAFQAMEIVAFDESGNTGQDLTIAEQPLFCLGSAHLTPEQMQMAEDILRKIKTSEWKFSKIKKNPAQINLVIQLLGQEWVTPKILKSFVIHKGFMIVTKIVDLIHEPLARLSGVDLYERGGALATANVLTSVGPSLLGETRFSRILDTFVGCMRKCDASTVAKLRREVASAYEFITRKHKDTVEGLLVPVLIACAEHPDWFASSNLNELDPLIPAYYRLIDDWGYDLDGGFILLADDSKVLAQEHSKIMFLSDPNLKEHVMEGPGGKSRYPLRVREIRGVSSHDWREVQIADLVAGASNYALTPMATHTKSNPQQAELRRLLADKQLLRGAIWPSSDVTPEALGAENVTGENSIDYLVRVFEGDPSTRRDS